MRPAMTSTFDRCCEAVTTTSMLSATACTDPRARAPRDCQRRDGDGRDAGRAGRSHGAPRPSHPRTGAGRRAGQLALFCVMFQPKLSLPTSSVNWAKANLRCSRSSGPVCALSVKKTVSNVKVARGVVVPGS